MSVAWTTIESDPGVFTELIEGLGVKGVQVEELWECSKEELERHEPVYGIIFLFKYGGEGQTGSLVQNNVVEDVPGLFFAKQVVENTCATQAILSILLNIKSDSIFMGPILSDFSVNTIEMTPIARGLAVSNSDAIRKVHNSFCLSENIAPMEKGFGAQNAYHFISYIPFNGRIYELDGLKPGPIDWGETGDNWICRIIPIIQERISRYSAGEVHFNLMAVVGNKKQIYSSKIAELTSQKDELTLSLFSPNENGCDKSKEEIENELFQISSQIKILEDQIAMEDEKFQRWHAENVRRRHDYTPFLFELLKKLAEDGKLKPLIENAKKKARYNCNQKSID